jgi:purine-cytosine permease-like protein
MNITTARNLWSRLLVILGTLAMLAGALDPLEGSLLILPGAGLVTLGTFLGNTNRALRRDWTVIFLLIAVGIGAMFVLSAAGGLGGARGHSPWWGLLILPYPLGWVLGIVSLLFRFARTLRRPQPA